MSPLVLLHNASIRTEKPVREIHLDEERLCTLKRFAVFAFLRNGEIYLVTETIPNLKTHTNQWRKSNSFEVDSQNSYPHGCVLAFLSIFYKSCRVARAIPILSYRSFPRKAPSGTQICCTFRTHHKIRFLQLVIE